MVAVSLDRKSTRLNSSHGSISYAVFCLKKKKKHRQSTLPHSSVAGQVPSTQRTCHAATAAVVVTGNGVPILFFVIFFFFFFKDPATTEIYPLSLHDALPICWRPSASRLSSPTRTPPPRRPRSSSTA